MMRSQDVERLEQALRDVRALARLRELELAAAADDLAPEDDVLLERRREVHVCGWPSTRQSM